MNIRKLIASVTAGGVIAAGAVLGTTSSAGALTNGSIASIAAASLNDNGGAATDRNPYDFDVLANAVVNLGLLGALDTTPNLTVFAPNDRAFQVLVADLGGGWQNEAGVLAFLGKLDPNTLKTVVLYHVLPERLTASQLLTRTNQATLAPGLNVRSFQRIWGTQWINVVDNDRNDVNAVAYKSIPASNGIIHVVSFVMRPIDLP